MWPWYCKKYISSLHLLLLGLCRCCGLGLIPLLRNCSYSPLQLIHRAPPAWQPDGLPQQYFGIWGLLIAAQLSQLLSMYVVDIVFRMTNRQEREVLGKRGLSTESLYIYQRHAFRKHLLYNVYWTGIQSWKWDVCVWDQNTLNFFPHIV